MSYSVSRRSIIERKLNVLFASDLEVERIVMGIEIFAGKKIDPDNTLLIFDEVQEVPRALSSLKYFCENALKNWWRTASLSAIEKASLRFIPVTGQIGNQVQ